MTGLVSHRGCIVVVTILPSCMGRDRLRQSNVTGYGLASPAPLVRCVVAATPGPQSRLGAKAVANSLYIGEAEAQTPLTGWPWVADTHHEKRRCQHEGDRLSRSGRCAHPCRGRRQPLQGAATAR